jgi:hypothetical protein
MNGRAVYDSKVIEAWSDLVTRYERGGRPQFAAFLALGATFVAFFFFPNPITLWLLVIAAALLLLATLLDKRPVAKCPHCKRSPMKLLHRGHAIDAECCAHCNYWLVSPYASDKSSRA